MGNVRSEHFEHKERDYFWDNTPRRQESVKMPNKPEETSRAERNKEKLNEIKQEMMRKHDKRRQIIAEKRKEFQDLRDTVEKQKKEIQLLKQLLNGDQKNEADENSALKEKVVELRTELMKQDIVIKKNEELGKMVQDLQKELEKMKKQVAGFEEERNDYQIHVTALKDVVKVSKQMLKIRENQLNELTRKIEEIEATMAEQKAAGFSDELRQEYERQLRNIRSLRQLYEERQKAVKKEKDELASQLDDTKLQLQNEQKRVRDLEERVEELEKANSDKYDEIQSLQSNLGLTKAECRDYQAEMAIINQLFSQILLGFNNNQDFDLDNLIKILEENHDLLQDIVNENDESNAMSSTLPKTLLDLINRMNGKETEEEVKTAAENQEPTILNLTSTTEIVENLPKVWKVLIQLLSHHCTPENILGEENGDPCYKLVQTKTGPTLVLSVSQTYIRLKDLILEKKSLEKETGRLKQLNTHLETRLQDQEKRLEIVSKELNKTWHIVGKLQKQHQQLHTQEKILKYELAQKRKLLTELKEELEYCREKWQQAREKNTNTEREWFELRTEFSSRKKLVADIANDSPESGYSEDRDSLTEEEDTSEAGPEEVEVQRKQSLIDVIQSEIKDIEESGTEEASEVEDICGVEEIREEIDEACCVTLPGNKEIEEMKSGEACCSRDCKEIEEMKTEACSGKVKQFSEEFLQAKDERLKRLEEEAKSLMSKVTETSNKRVNICSKLESLHETYGSKSDSQEEKE